ncbi:MULTISPECIES: hypothetical protein [unclassified Polaribacter]|nr:MULTISPECIES: hypothetical protein [unclassified Polaribacter]
MSPLKSTPNIRAVQKGKTNEDAVGSLKHKIKIGCCMHRIN